ncbi:hypothetical protein LTR86_007437 [Recurvomyces mirabilis]|nr:hypothetical protein LTR86_007437 [Recurvomyces mirabilis]
MSAAHIGSPASGASGKKLKTKLTSKKASVTSFIGPPHLFKVQRQLSNGSRLQRLIQMHNTLVKYEKISAPFDTDMIASKATSELKLILAGRRGPDAPNEHLPRSAAGLAAKGSGAEDEGRLYVTLTTSVELQTFNVRDVERSNRVASSDAASGASEMLLYDTTATTNTYSPKPS